jgi:hypothetical protein
MKQREKPLEGCQYIFENGMKCSQPFSGTAWQFCSDHRDAGRKQAKAERNKVSNAKFRQAKPEQYSLNQFLCRYQLTKRQLRPYVGTAAALREQCPSSKYDRHE